MPSQNLKLKTYKPIPLSPKEKKMAILRFIIVLALVILAQSAPLLTFEEQSAILCSHPSLQGGPDCQDRVPPTNRTFIDAKPSQTIDPIHVRTIIGCCSASLIYLISVLIFRFYFRMSWGSALTFTLVGRAKVRIESCVVYINGPRPSHSEAPV